MVEGQRNFKPLKQLPMKRCTACGETKRLDEYSLQDLDNIGKYYYGEDIVHPECRRCAMIREYTRRDPTFNAKTYEYRPLYSGPRDRQRSEELLALYNASLKYMPADYTERAKRPRTPRGTPVPYFRRGVYVDLFEKAGLDPARSAIRVADKTFARTWPEQAKTGVKPWKSGKKGEHHIQYPLKPLELPEEPQVAQPKKRSWLARLFAGEPRQSADSVIELSVSPQAKPVEPTTTITATTTAPLSRDIEARLVELERRLSILEGRGGPSAPEQSQLSTPTNPAKPTTLPRALLPKAPPSAKPSAKQPVASTQRPSSGRNKTAHEDPGGQDLQKNLELLVHKVVPGPVTRNVAGTQEILCPNCLLFKVEEKYSRDRQTALGRKRYCKACTYDLEQQRLARTKAREAGQPAPPPIPTPNIELVSQQGYTKVCAHCKRELPLMKFRRSTRARDGYQTRCYDCTSHGFTGYAEVRARNSKTTRLAAQRAQPQRSPSQAANHNPIREVIELYTRSGSRNGKG